MEQFDLVDEQDNVIGVTDKPTSHADGGIHRLVAVYVFTPDGRLYVQDHVKSKLWDHSIGGHVHRGESYNDAARREAAEELGITAPLARISTFYSDERYTGFNLRHYFGLFECAPPDSWKFMPNDEVKNIFPMTLAVIVKGMNETPEKFTGGFLGTMREYIKRKNLPLELE